MSNSMTNPFENELPTVESLGMPATMTPMDAIKFAKYIIDVLGHRGPMGPEEWIKYGDQWKEESGYAQAGADDTTGVENDDSVLGDYATSTATNGGQNGGETIDEITVVEKFPTNPGLPGEMVKFLGTIYVYDALTGWTPKDGVTTHDDTYTGDDPIGVVGEVPEGFDWSSILSGVGGIAGLASLLGWEGLGGGDEDDEELSLLEKLFEIVKSKKAIDDYNKYTVPTGQMDAQSAIGKQWGLPSKESMVMQGLGPNILQGQKYAMRKGTKMPAATHVSGMPLLEEIEGGNQGGIMGLKSHGDITPAFLEPGEFVFTKKATDNIGAKRLYKLMKQAEQMGIG